MKLPDKLIRDTANQFVVPVIIDMLKPFDTLILQAAIEGKQSLAQALKEDGAVLQNIRQWASLASMWFDDVKRIIASKKWIDWFIDDSLRAQRPDLWAIVNFHPQGRQWLHAQVTDIVTLILD